jgi:hypothetical protein
MRQRFTQDDDGSDRSLRTAQRALNPIEKLRDAVELVIVTAVWEGEHLMQEV